MDDDKLTRLAEEELMREAKRGEARAAVHGVMGWLKDKTPKTNKRFLSTTISNALQHNHRQRSAGNHKISDARVNKHKDKSKQKERTKPYSCDKKTEEKSLRHFHYHKSSKLPSECYDDDDDDNVPTEVERSDYHSPKRK